MHTYITHNTQRTHTQHIDKPILVRLLLFFNVICVGDLDTLQKAFTEWKTQLSASATAHAAQNGHLHVLQWLIGKTGKYLYILKKPPLIGV